MGSPVSLRDDFDAAALRSLARRTRDASQGRRLLALAAIYDGGSRGDAARMGSVGLRTGLSTARRRGRRRSSTRPSARRLPGLSRAGRSRRYTGLSAGG